MRYAHLQTAIWQHRGLRAMPRHLREMYLYLVTSPHGNTAGLYALPLSYLAEDLQLQPAEAQDTLAALCETGRIQYDWQAGVVLIRDYLEHNAPNGSKQVGGVIAVVRSIPSSGLLADWVTWATHHVPACAELWQGLLKTKPTTATAIAHKPAEPAPPDERQTLFDWLQRHMPHTINKTNVDLMEAMAEETSYAVIRRAAEVAVGENKRQWSYVQGVWRRYRDERCRSYADALAADERKGAPTRASPGGKGLSGLAAELARVRGERTIIEP